MVEWLKAWWSGLAPLAMVETQPPVVQHMTPGLRVNFDEMMSMQGQFQASGGNRTDSASYFNPFSGIGGGGDKGAAARPNVNWTPLSSLEKKILFRRSGLASRMCGIYPTHSWRSGWTIDVAKKRTSRKAKRVQKVAEDLGFDLEAMEAATFANRDGTYLLVGIFEEEPNSIDRLTGLPAIDLALPPKKINKILALQPFERDQMSVAAWNWDMRSGNYFEPLVWGIYPAMGGRSLYVHRSRCLWFRGAELSGLELYANAGFDDSLLDRWGDEIRNKSQIGQIGATIAQELSIKVLQIAGKAGASSEDQARTFMGRLSMWWRSMSVGNIGVIGAEDKVTQAGSTVTGFAELTEEAWTALAAISDIPRTVLTGEPPGGLNADGQAQRENWGTAVHIRQVAKNNPILRQFLGWCWEAEGGAPDDWAIRWAPLDTPTEVEVANIRKIYAEADKVYLDKGVLLPSTVAQSRFGGAVFGTEITLEGDVAEAKTLGNLALAAQKAQMANAQAQGAGSPATGGGPKKTPTGESGG